MDNTIDMIPEESLRKLNQLKLTLTTDNLERQVEQESLANSDLKYLNKDQIDHSEFIPFIISAIQGIDKAIGSSLCVHVNVFV